MYSKASDSDFLDPNGPLSMKMSSSVIQLVE